MQAIHKFNTFLVKPADEVTRVLHGWRSKYARRQLAVHIVHCVIWEIIENEQKSLSKYSVP